MQNEVKSQTFITMQTTMTVRTDAQLKAEFTSLCEEFGMSANTAMNIFMRAVAETKSIPFTLLLHVQSVRLQMKERTYDSCRY